jgi:hypothetical protein
MEVRKEMMVKEKSRLRRWPRQRRTQMPWMRSRGKRGEDWLLMESDLLFI